MWAIEGCPSLCYALHVLQLSNTSRNAVICNKFLKHRVMASCEKQIDVKHCLSTLGSKVACVKEIAVGDDELV